MVWTDEMETGIDVIDEQHKRIVDYIYQLEWATKHRDRESVGEVLRELTDYTLTHFAFEESMMEEAGYRMSKPHKSVHESFTKRVVKYQERHNEGEDINEQLSSMLSTWLMHHIMRDDMLYVEQVKLSLGIGGRNKADIPWISRLLS